MEILKNAFEDQSVFNSSTPQELQFLRKAFKNQLPFDDQTPQELEYLKNAFENQSLFNDSTPQEMALKNVFEDPSTFNESSTTSDNTTTVNHQLLSRVRRNISMVKVGPAILRKLIAASLIFGGAAAGGAAATAVDISLREAEKEENSTSTGDEILSRKRRHPVAVAAAKVAPALLTFLGWKIVYELKVEQLRMRSEHLL